MFISHKDNKIIAFSQIEWECRFFTKKIPLEDYWTWVKSITTDGVPDYSGEDYSVEEVDQDMDDLLASGYISQDIDKDYYHLKWDSSSKKVVGDDDAKTAWELAKKWKRIRDDRNRRLVETDYLALKDNTLSNDMKTYRQALRDVPKQTDPDNITWPSKPS